jgi:hypothetical protein
MSLDCLSGFTGEMVAKLNRCLKNEHTAQHAMARIRQRRIAREVHGRGDLRSVKGLGTPTLEVDSYAYHYWGQRLGYECWHDKQFLREFWRDNPDARVKAKGIKPQQVGWEGDHGRHGGAGEARIADCGLRNDGGKAVRFRKVYPAAKGVGV